MKNEFIKIQITVTECDGNYKFTVKGKVMDKPVIAMGDLLQAILNANIKSNFEA